MSETKAEAREREVLKAMRRRIADSIHGECWIEYAIIHYTKEGLAFDSLDQIAVEGATRVEAEDDYNEPEGPPFKGADLFNPTWLEIAIEANKRAHYFQNRHHVYFEGIFVERVDEDGTKIVSLSLGS